MLREMLGIDLLHIMFLQASAILTVLSPPVM